MQIDKKIFGEKDAVPIVIESFNEFKQYFYNHYTDLEVEILNSLKEICSKVLKSQSNDIKGNIKYISYSLLRSSFIDSNFTYIIEAQDEFWMFDKVDCNCKISFEWVFKIINAMKNKLNAISKKYVGKIKEDNINEFILILLVSINYYFMELIRNVAYQINDMPEFEQIKKNELLEIRVGEYRDYSEVVYRYKSDLNTNLLIRDAEKKYGINLAHLDFSHIQEKHNKYENLNFSYTNFTNANFKELYFSKSNFTGSNFNNAKLVNINILKSAFHNSNFLDSVIEDCLFLDIEASAGFRKTSALLPINVPLNFENARIKNTKFISSNLNGAIFINSILENVDFTDSSLLHAVFSEEALPYLKLSNKQFNEILVLKKQEGDNNGVF